MRHNRTSLIENLINLGIKQGDVVFMGADLSKVGIIDGNIGKTIINSMLDAVGKEGTLVTNTFSKSFIIPHIDKNFIFDNNTISYTGSLSKLFLSHPDCLRSKHPTNSFAAIGKNSEYILAGHDSSQTSYYPLQRVLELKGKQMLIGCVDKSNGLASIHLAQETLGLSKRSILKKKVGVYYKEGDDIKLFSREDFGGCSKGFYKFYNEFVVKNILVSGYYGDAYTVLTDLVSSYDIVYRILKTNPRYALCDDPNCFDCRGSWLYNKRDWPKYYARNLFSITKKIISY